MTESQRQPVPRTDAGEIETALAFLDFARGSVLKKLEGLSEDDAQRAVLPSGTGIARLIRHLTDGERYWFVVNFTGEGEEPDWDAVGTTTLPVAQIVDDYRRAIAHSNDVVRRAGGADMVAVGHVDGQHKTLRWIVAHMTSETARHAGHADAVRELIDGVTGR